MKEFYVIPTIGQFKVTVTPHYDFYDKTKISFYILNIGGVSDKCVNITIHSEDSPRRKEFILSWAEVLGKGCTINSQVIRGDSTVQMVQLGFTIAKEIAPYAEYVTLSDMSYFICNTPDGKKKMSLPPFHIAFYDKTWYEDKFGAVMIHDKDYIEYRGYVENLYKEGIMPPDFDFGNMRIRELLYPLYSDSKTWKQFFQLIEKYYKKEKCAMMYPWIHNAMKLIFEGNQAYVGQDWKIVLKSIPMIHYYQVNKSSGGNRDSNDIEYEPQHYNYRDVNYNETMNWDIDTFLSRRNMTRKGYKRIKVQEYKKTYKKKHN
jgi:hypothetical protein